MRSLPPAIIHGLDYPAFDDFGRDVVLADPYPALWISSGSVIARYLIQSGDRSSNIARVAMGDSVRRLWDSDFSTHEVEGSLLLRSILTIGAFSPREEDLSERSPEIFVAVRFPFAAKSSPGQKILTNLIRTARAVAESANYNSLLLASRAVLPWRALTLLNRYETMRGIRELLANLDASWVDVASSWAQETEQVIREAAEKSTRLVSERSRSSFERVESFGVRMPPAVLAPNEVRGVSEVFDRADALRQFRADAAPGPADDGGQVLVWYGTDRAPSEDSPGYLDAPSSPRELAYGAAIVDVPRRHRFGQVRAPWWRRWTRTGRSESLRIVSYLRMLDEFEFVREATAHLRSRQQEERVGFLYVHGYNTSFDQSIVRTAQLAFDLNLPGLPIAYTWPSAARLSGYMHDVDNINLSEPFFAEFLRTLSDELRLDRIDVVAHSMGNRLLAGVVEAARREGKDHQFGSIILAAPDMNVESFHNASKIYSGVADSATMYVSERDQALDASRMLSSTPRAGLTPPVTVASGVHTIEVTDIDVSRLGHGYYAEAAAVLNDVKAVLSGTPDPSQRARLIPMTVPPEPYWRLRR